MISYKFSDKPIEYHILCLKQKCIIFLKTTKIIQIKHRKVMILLEKRQQN